MLIAISGKIGSGKDTTARFILEYLWSKKVNINMMPCKDLNTLVLENSTNTYIKKFAFKVKLFASFLLNVPISKFEDQEYKKSKLGEEWSFMTVREFLIKLATEGLRDNLHKDVWINGLLSDYDGSHRWIITDLRFKNEFEALKKKGAVLIRVERLYNNPRQINHASENELDHAPFEHILINSGSNVDDFRLEVFKLCQSIGL